MEYDKKIDCPCPCGEGRVRVVWASPNYSFGTGYASEEVIDCSSCAEQYRLTTRAYDWVLYKKSDEAEAAKRHSARHAKAEQISANKIEPVCAVSIRHIRSGGNTKAAWFKVVSDFIYDGNPPNGGLKAFEADIRRNGGSLATWVRSAVHLGNFQALAKKLKMPDDPTTAVLLAEHEALAEEARQAKTPHILLPTLF